MTTEAATANRAALCRDNLDQLDRIDGLFADPIGKHVRHVLEHYESLLQGTDGCIDYETRSRDPDVRSTLTSARIVRCGIPLKGICATRAES